jgi:glycosyltransferase involved in cell wall biosynthesis
LEFSVVIPTHDRLEVLPEVLSALEGQQGAPAFEVVVVDDGSTDGTAEFLAGWRPALPARIVRQDNRGPAAARNRGVEEARAERVAFLGDDTVPAPGWLAAHRAAHQRLGFDPERAVIGYTRWHRRMRATPFLRHINEHGLQFGYALIRDPDDVPFNFFYTSNLSLGREILLAERFDTSFPYAAWEDIEAGYRLFSRGLKLAYEPRAVAEHDHPTDLGRFAVRQEKAGYSAVLFHRLHPELGPFLGLGPTGPPPLPPPWSQRLREGLVRALQNLPMRLPRTWEEVLRYHYIRGLHRGWAEAGPGKEP